MRPQERAHLQRLGGLSFLFIGLAGVLVTLMALREEPPYGDIRDPGIYALWLDENRLFFYGFMLGAVAYAVGIVGVIALADRLNELNPLAAMFGRFWGCGAFVLQMLFGVWAAVPHALVSAGTWDVEAVAAARPAYAQLGSILHSGFLMFNVLWLSSVALAGFQAALDRRLAYFTAAFAIVVALLFLTLKVLTLHRAVTDPIAILSQPIAIAWIVWAGVVMLRSPLPSRPGTGVPPEDTLPEGSVGEAGPDSRPVGRA